MTVYAPSLRIRVGSTRRTYWQVLWDWLIDEYAPGIRDLGVTKEGEPRDSVPDVFRLVDSTGNGYYVFLNEEWEFFTFDLLCLSYFGKAHQFLSDVEYNWIAARWKGLYNGGLAFCNNQGTDTNRNWITRKEDDMNKDATKGIGLFTLVCGGASVERVIDPVTMVKYEGVLRDVIRVDAFDGTKPPPDVSKINIETDPRVFFATRITNQKEVGGYRVKPFNFLENPTTGEIHDVPIPIIATRPLYYPIGDLRFAGGSKPRAYYA